VALRAHEFLFCILEKTRAPLGKGGYLDKILVVPVVLVVAKNAFAFLRALRVLRG
jgi:hypothetical protein